jgi:hypothetical protein
MAAHIFALLKWAGVNCELATEFAKDKVWEGSFKVLDDQTYIFGKQQHRMSRLNGQVEVIVTDSPIFNSIIYGDKLSDTFKDLVMETHESYTNLNYFIYRVKPYNPKGRMQDEDGAKELDRFIKGRLDEYKLPYEIVDGTTDGVKQIVTDVLKMIRPTQG